MQVSFEAPAVEPHAPPRVQLRRGSRTTAGCSRRSPSRRFRSTSSSGWVHMDYAQRAAAVLTPLLSGYDAAWLART